MRREPLAVTLSVALLAVGWYIVRAIAEAGIAAWEDVDPRCSECRGSCRRCGR